MDEPSRHAARIRYRRLAELRAGGSAMKLLAAIGMLAISGCAFSSRPLEIHVSPRGNDASSGRLTAPMATLENAIAQARAIPNRPRTIADSGIVIRSYRDEPVILRGGINIDDFKPVTDEQALNRMEPGIRKHVLCADL